MSEEELEKIKDQVINELVEKDLKTVYDVGGYEYDVDDWNFRNKVKEQFNEQLIAKTKEVFDGNKEVIETAVKDLIADLLPSIIYDYLTGNMDNNIQQVLVNQRNQSVNECLNYIRNNLKI